MPILCAYALPHPPLAIPKVGRGEEIKIQQTLSAFNEVAKEIAMLAPETIIFVTPHNIIYSDYFHISPGSRAKGNLARFGVPDVRFDARYDTALSKEISHHNELAGPLGEKDASLDHGVTVPMWFINQYFSNYKAVRISQAGMDAAEHYRLGMHIAESTDKLKRKAVLIASGDLSHKLFETTEGVDFDKSVTDYLSSASFLDLLTIPENLRESAAECGYNSYAVLAGCFDRRKVDSKLLSYEGPFGVGYAIARFAPGEPDETRNFLEQYTDILLAKAREYQQTEDCYRALARQALEHVIANPTSLSLPLPNNLPNELLTSRAGVFVSLHKNEKLRGCIGTISPTTNNIALEIIRSAISAGLDDNRFSPVTIDELPFLAYKVDVLSAPELISDASKLDVKRYGVIVSSGNKRGLLLPNLDGIDTVESQIDIARRKGGITIDAPITLERFEVIRHE